MVIFENITPQILIQDELIKLNDYKDSLLETVSHDLRTPLNAITSAIHSIQ